MWYDNDTVNYVIFFMKKDIHPKYFEATVRCACGNTFTTGSILEQIDVEICSQCHPFYTGKQKLVDTARRVEKFQEKQAKTKALKEKTSKARALKKQKKQKAAPADHDQSLEEKIIKSTSLSS